MIKKWFENLWYHYKWFIITAILAAFVLTVVTVQCATKPKFDLSVVVAFNKSAIGTEQIDIIKNGIKDYAEDYNGDGEINLNLINCTLDENSKDVNYVISMRQKLQVSAMGESSAILYITDDSALKYIDDIKADIGGFFQDMNLPDYNGKALKISNLPFFSELKKTGNNIPKNIYISKRIIKDTLIELEGDVKFYEQASDDFLNKLIEQ